MRNRLTPDHGHSAASQKENLRTTDPLAICNDLDQFVRIANPGILCFVEHRQIEIAALRVIKGKRLDDFRNRRLGLRQFIELGGNFFNRSSDENRFGFVVYNFCSEFFT